MQAESRRNDDGCRELESEESVCLHVDNNIFVECRRAISARGWGEEQWKNRIKSGWNGLWRRFLLEEVDITSPPFTERYPELKGFFKPEDRPRMNHAVRNVAVRCEDFIQGNYIAERNWVTREDPGFVDAECCNFALREDATVFRHIPDFEPIPFDRIGLYRDGLRPELPNDSPRSRA